ncbi:lytic transglycosylase domain-containing protein [Altererythrobacter sp. GH1-8]|uniref:lytic transglycosylase domain-containing protein n=1 Tax=Altererythrobacter sp. GH1-8 TaxID=3349333 RepID=UPI00374D1867
MRTRAILRLGAAATTFCLTAAFADAARADVIEIDNGDVFWKSGGPQTRPVHLPGQVGVETNGSLSNGATIPARYVDIVAVLSHRYDLSPALIEALVWQESRWNQGAVSPKGARGLAQLMPATARYLQVDPDDPVQNLEGGARYLREQLDRFDGNLEWALAAYNAGPGRVERARGVPRIRETQDYVASIMARLTQFTPPKDPDVSPADLFDHEETDYYEVAYLQR